MALVSQRRQDVFGLMDVDHGALTPTFFAGDGFRFATLS
jgi:hypothetical protein